MKLLHSHMTKVDTKDENFKVVEDDILNVKLQVGVIGQMDIEQLVDEL